MTSDSQSDRGAALSAGAAGGVAAKVSAVTSIEDAVDDADFIEEAMPKRVDLKKEILARISHASFSAAFIGTNTSNTPISELVGSVHGTGRFAGVHFSNPAPFIPGVEVITHESSDRSVVAAINELLDECGKPGGVVRDSIGFVLNRLQDALACEAKQLVEERTATPAEIDTIVRTTFGFRLPFFGAFAIADIAGLDDDDFCYASLQSGFPEWFATPRILSNLVATGELGTKSGGGFLDIPADWLPALIGYRNRPYVEMQRLLDRLDLAPVD